MCRHGDGYGCRLCERVRGVEIKVGEKLERRREYTTNVIKELMQTIRL